MEEEFSELGDTSPISDSNIELAIDFEDLATALDEYPLDHEVMVSNTTRREVHKHADFDIHKWQWQFIGSPSDDDFCCLCKKILKEPMLIECCGAQVCKTCIEPKLSFKGYLNSLDWSVRMEHWSGTLEWSTGASKLNIYDLNFTVTTVNSRYSVTHGTTPSGWNIEVAAFQGTSRYPRLYSRQCHMHLLQHARSL